jgi:tetratricopeptide (TPR) repeat protein
MSDADTAEIRARLVQLKRDRKHAELHAAASDAVRRFPGRPDFRYLLAQAARLLGRYDEALSELKPLETDRKYATRAQQEYTLIYLRTGKPDLAIDHAQRVLKSNPDNTTFLWGYLRLLAEFDDPHRALATFFTETSRLRSASGYDLDSGAVTRIATAFERRTFFTHAEAVLLHGWNGSRDDFDARILPWRIRRGVTRSGARDVFDALERNVRFEDATYISLFNALLDTGGSEQLLARIDEVPEGPCRNAIEVALIMRLQGIDQALPRAQALRGNAFVQDSIALTHLVHSAGIEVSDTAQPDIAGRLYSDLMTDTEAIDRSFAAPNRIAVVGNGPSERGLGRGPQIDDHDVVIRFNRASTDPTYWADYGRKTTFLVRLVRWLERPLPAGADDAMPVLLSADPHTFRDWSSAISSPLRNPIRPLRRSSIYSSLIEILGRRPSSGLFVLSYLSALRDGTLEGCSCYAFSFLDQLLDNRTSHYFDSSQPNPHNWLAERAVYQALLSSGWSEHGRYRFDFS